MEQLLASKESIIETINKIVMDYSNGIEIQNKKLKVIQLDNEQLTKLTQKMTHEIAEKDKLLSRNEKTIHEYSTIINNLQEESSGMTRRVLNHPPVCQLIELSSIEP